MQGNDGRYTKTPQDRLLTEVLNACMEEQLSFIPPEREIARMHTFSQEFQAYMQKLLKTKGKPERISLSKKEFVFRFNKVAASLLAVLVVGSLCAGALLILAPKSKSFESMAPAESPSMAAPESSMDMAETKEESAEAEEAAPMEEEAPAEETIPEKESGDTESGVGVGFPEEVEFMGSKIHLASIQTLPEETQDVKTLVSSPLADREAESIKVTVGNMGDYPIYYYEVMDLEVLIDGAWYLVPSKQEFEEHEQQYMEMLKAGMAQDEELLLEYYDLDYEAEKYRVVTYFDGLILSSEFRFEEN